MHLVEQQGHEQRPVSVGRRAARVGCGFLENPTGPASWSVRVHSHGEVRETWRNMETQDILRHTERI